MFIFSCIRLGMKLINIWRNGSQSDLMQGPCDMTSSCIMCRRLQCLKVPSYQSTAPCINIYQSRHSRLKDTKPGHSWKPNSNCQMINICMEQHLRFTMEINSLVGCHLNLLPLPGDNSHQTIQYHVCNSSSADFTLMVF